MLPLTPTTFHILVALAPGERHGYRLMQDVAALSRGTIRLGPGTLYSTLNRMVNLGLVAETAERPDPTLDDTLRPHYVLTAFGRRVMAAEADRYSDLIRHTQAQRSESTTNVLGLLTEGHA